MSESAARSSDQSLLVDAPVPTGVLAVLHAGSRALFSPDAKDAPAQAAPLSRAVSAGDAMTNGHAFSGVQEAARSSDDGMSCSIVCDSVAFR